MDTAVLIGMSAPRCLLRKKATSILGHALLELRTLLHKSGITTNERVGPRAEHAKCKAIRFDMASRNLCRRVERALRVQDEVLHLSTLTQRTLA